jgi:chromosome partitioning protein
MLVIAIVSQKGGSGKTTIATLLGAAATADGKTACIIDTDPQATAALWGDWRGDADPEVVTCPPVRLTTILKQLARRGVEVVVIDTPPHADIAAREAIRAADLILIPTRLRAFDLHAMTATAELVRYAGKSAFVILNGVPARATRWIADATATAQSHGLSVSPLALAERAAFHRSSARGEVASETEPEGKAAAEANALWRWVAEQLAFKQRA